MNRQFLKHDYFTDIISFELENSPSRGMVAEIYISTDRVRDNARRLDIPIKQELHRVIFHGVLHFCGYADKTLTQKIEMRYREDHYLQRYFTPKRST
jgi:rRNA maturation RNase YbeY